MNEPNVGQPAVPPQPVSTGPTLFCRGCGSEVNANAAVCTQCGVAQAPAQAAPASAPAVNAGPAFCGSCGSAVSANAAVCLSCGAAVKGAGVNSGGSSKQPFIALLLSFLIIGAGQFYVGDDMQKALIMFIGAIVAFFLGFVLIFPFFAVFGLWIWSMIDAYQSAGRWNVSHGFPESG